MVLGPLLLLLLSLPLLSPSLLRECIRPLRLRKKQVTAIAMIPVPSIEEAAVMPIYVVESRWPVLGGKTVDTVCMEGETSVDTVCMEGEAGADGSARGRV